MACMFSGAMLINFRLILNEEGGTGIEILRLRASLYAFTSYSKRVARCLGGSALLTRGSAALH